MVLLRAVGAWEFAGRTEEFCQRNGLRPRAVGEVAKLRQQLTNSGIGGRREEEGGRREGTLAQGVHFLQ